MAGVVGRDEGSWAGAGYESPAEPVLHVVVRNAEVVELVEAGDVGLGPRGAVVDLDVGARAAFDAAGG
ncbi:MAG: hypothetical protein M5T61_02515 [Acidimicrobiia bacterium]|nr:hypothetical protein [Acidimicrobiia bacterium]